MDLLQVRDILALQTNFQDDLFQIKELISQWLVGEDMAITQQSLLYKSPKFLNNT